MTDRNQIIKIGSWIVGAIAIAVIAYAGLIYARAYSESIQPSSFRNFSVSGEGKVVAIPDVAEFSFGVITQGGKNIADAQKQNTDKINALIGFVKEQGVDAKDIKTQQFSIEPRYQYYSCPGPVMTSSGGATARPCPPPDIVGYTITQNVTVKIRNFDTIGTIMGPLSQKGANSVSQLSFTIDDPTRLENEAREKAIKQAQEKATLVAQAGHFTIGKLLAIDEGGEQPLPMMNAAVGGVRSMAMTAAPATPTIEPGSQEVTVNILLRYEIK